MSSFAETLPEWLSTLSLWGKVMPNAPLAPQSWFRVGGNAEILFQPEHEEDLSTFLAGCPSSVPLTVIGNASNLLIRDGGIEGVVIKLGPSFARSHVLDDVLTAGAASVDTNVARIAASFGLGGFTFLCGIPGTIGGAIRMNAGCYGSEIKDTLIDVDLLDRSGQKQTLTAQECGFAYRSCAIPNDWIILQARFKGTPADPDALQTEMKEIQTKRASSQPVRMRTGGSTFANPENDPKGRKAWQLIDEAGCRGLKRGGAMVSDLHCNFLINTGDATAADIEGLGEEVLAAVERKTGIRLKWEIRRIGKPAAGGAS